MEETKSNSDFPVPQLYDWNRPFFTMEDHRKLQLQRCGKCGALIYYPRPVCPNCLSDEYKWVELSGRGVIYSYSIVWKPGHPVFENEVPIILVAVQIEEGPILISNLKNCEIDRIDIGMPVKVIFEKINEDIALPKFEPA